MTDLAYVDGGQFQPRGDVAKLLRRAAEEHPDVEAVVSTHQKPLRLPGIQPRDGDTRLAWTFQQLQDGSDNLARRLTSLGLCKGTAVAVFSNNYAEWALLCWAAIQMGCPLVPLNPLLVANVDELRYVLQVICPGLVVVEDEDMARMADRNAPDEISQTFLRVTLSSLKRPYILEEQFPDHYRPQTHHTTNTGRQEEITERQHNPVADSAMHRKAIGWISLPYLWSTNLESIQFPKRATKRSFEDTVMIVFTSGTTSFPKACPHSSDNFQMFCALPKGPGHRFCQHVPAYHGIASFSCLCAWVNGSTIVYPSAKFDVIASLDALENESCTTMAAVPAMIKAISMVPNISQRRFDSLSDIALAGASVFPEVVQLCRELLRPKGIEVSWGMTESPAPITFALTEEMGFNKDGFFPVGKPVPGTKVKLCAPGSRVPLKRGMEGELHTGGGHLIRGYLNADNDIFYEDEEGRWVATGDMACMDDDGNLSILGRYKDIIIRGGVNIAPANIERRLNSIPGVDSQVVGIPDEMAGEVPVAVVKLHGPAAENPNATIAKLQELAIRELGPKLVPTRYLDLEEDLQMGVYPMTSSGKVKKRQLRDKALDFLTRRAQLKAGGKQPSQSTEDALTDIWSHVSGLSAENIGRGMSVLTFVDSITIMRFSSAVMKQLQKDVSVLDITQNPSVAEQAQLLDSRPIIKADNIKRRIGPPTAQDMAHCHGDEPAASRTKGQASPFLTKLGLTWADDVEDVIPAPDTLSIYLSRSRPQTWNHRSVFMAYNTPHDEIVKAWKAAVCHHPLARSLAINYDEPEQQLFLVLRDNEAWWRCSILPNITISDISELRDTLLDGWADPDAGPLIKVAFVGIKNNPRDTAMIFVGNHSLFDSISASFLFEDFATMLQKQLSSQEITSVPEHTPFKVYADAYHLHRKGPAAAEAVSYHAKRLQGVGNLKPALWPPQRAPHWFKGAHSGWKASDGTLGDPAQRKPLDVEAAVQYGLDGVEWIVKLPGLPALKENYGIPPYVILKAAVTLFNIHRTGSSAAIFASFEAARYWPFTTDDGSSEGKKDKQLPNPLTVSGPMFEVVVNRIEVSDKHETVIKFLQRIFKDQTELSAHAHVPLRELLNSPSLTAEDAAVIRDVMTRQSWNWPAGVQMESGPEVDMKTQPQHASSRILKGRNDSDDNHEPAFEELSRRAFDDVGVAWTCRLLDKERINVNISYDDCQLSRHEAAQALAEVLSAAEWLVANADSLVGVGVGDVLLDRGYEALRGLFAGNKVVV